jgi:sulfonate transport system substrate-binding protein
MIQFRSPLALLSLTLCSWLLAACSSPDRPAVVRLDYATYNPLSLLLKDSGQLEQDLGKDGVSVEWVKSLGSNKALELLSSESVDFGSTAGAAALIARANKNPIRAIYVYSKPEWTALVTRADSGIQTVADLRGKKVAVTRGTDPFVFLLRALDSAGLGERDVELVPLQHADGKLALERGDVQAWAGLDPLMASAELEGGARLFFRNADWNTYGVLDVRQRFAEQYPGYVDRVLRAYEWAHARALAAPEQLKAALAKEAHLSDAVAARVLARTDLTSTSIGEAQRSAIALAGDVLKKSLVIPAETDVGATTQALIDPTFAAKLAH